MNNSAMSRENTSLFQENSSLFQENSSLFREKRRSAWLALGLLLLSVGAMGIGASVGSTGWESVWHMQQDPVAWQIVWDIRLPRTLGAWLAGALLGLAGAVAQFA